MSMLPVSFLSTQFHGCATSRGWSASRLRMKKNHGVEIYAATLMCV